MAYSCRARLSLLRCDLATAIEWAHSINEAPVPSALFMWLEIPSITHARVLIADGTEASLVKATELLDTLAQLAQTCRFQNKEIAEKLSVSPATIKSHLESIYQKLNVGNRREAVDMAKKIGIL